MRIEPVLAPEQRALRRRVLRAAIGGAVPRALGPVAGAATAALASLESLASTASGASAGAGSTGGSGPAVSADPAPTLDAAIRAFTGGAPVRAGKVRVQIAPLVDNGNTVPLTVSVDHPMRAEDHVAAIAVFSERNPQHEVASFGLGPRNPYARVSTRIRLATSQKLVAIARLSDGSHWSGEFDVIVTLAACIED